MRGDYDLAASTLRDSAELARAHGDSWGLAQAVSNMAHLSRRQGDFARATALYEESGALYREIGDRRGEAISLTNLGRLAERQGDFQRAIEMHGQSLDASRTLGDKRRVSTALANLGVAYLRRGDLDLAARTIRESLGIRQVIGDREGMATSLEKLAEVEAGRSRADRALRLWAAAAALRDAIGAPLAPSERASYDVVTSAARAVMAEQQVTLLWSEARQVSLDQAVALALRMTRAGPLLRSGTCGAGWGGTNRRPYPARTGRAAPAGDPYGSRDSRQALHRSADGCDARYEHPQQAWCEFPDCSRGSRDPSRVDLK